MVNITQKLKAAINNPFLVPWLVGHRLATQLSYRFSHYLNGWALPPEAINIYPTFRCNLRCTMCFEKFYESKTELNPDEWIEIIKYVKRFHPRIHISGGEPFCYKGIIHLIEYIKSNRLFLHITTNGTFLSQYAKEIVKMGVNRIDVSIDGPREVHDKIRGAAGTFDCILDGLNRIKEQRGRGGLPSIRINSIINFENPRAMEELIKIGEDFRAETIQFIHPLFLDSSAVESYEKFLVQNLKRNINYWRRADNFRTKPDNFDDAVKILNRLNKSWPIRVEVFPSFNSLQLKAYYNMEAEFYSLLQNRCRAMWSTATILPSGDVESCPDYIVGNCRKENFLSIWNNQIMRTLRRRIRNRRFFSVCRACCFLYQ